MRKQYHARLVGTDRHVWDIHRLIRLSACLPVRDVPLREIAEIDENWWYADQEAVPTPRSIAEHLVLVREADFSHPVILCAEGRLMDGMHRVVRALSEGREAVRAVRFPTTPEPDYVNVPLAALPYPDEDIGG